MKVPPLKVIFEEKDREFILKEIDAVLNSGMLSAGKNVKSFEDFWATYTDCRHAVACSNGGAALEIILKSLNIKGKDVLVPTNTFIATINAIIFAGGNPILLDTDSKTMGVSLQEIKNKKTSNTVGIVVVYIGGIISQEMPEISKWCAENKIWLIEDAAHAHGSELNGKRAGKFGIAAAYSFFATKVVTSGEGGMIVTDDDLLAQQCRSYRDYGKKTEWISEHYVLSSNYRISEITAIIGMSQSKRIDDFISGRDRIAGIYTKGLKDIIEIIHPKNRCSWYKYIALLQEGIDRNMFKVRLKEMGVSLSGGVYDVPIHRQPVFKGMFKDSDFSHANDICSRHICLPIFYTMTYEQADYTIDTIRKVIKSLT